MPKTKLYPTTESGTNRDLGTYAWIFCPGCKCNHRLRIRMPAEPTAQEIEDQQMNRAGLWTFNGDLDKPTFTASLLIGQGDPSYCCHSQITDGKIFFYQHSHHVLKGQTVELPDIDL